ncbi:MAG: CHAT domain-containing tetratricopeptide repeat protein [Acidobacteriota bacterium]
MTAPSEGGGPADFEHDLEHIAQLVGDDERRRFFELKPELLTVEQVRRVCTEVARQVQIDAEKALELAAAARFIAEHLDDGESRALASRAAANAYHFSGDYRLAQELYGRALEAFIVLGDDVSAAVTRSSALHNLGYLGDYELAYAWAAEARRVFVRRGDRLRLAIVDHNLANVLHRQARWTEALERYTAAHLEFEGLDRAEDAAVCLNNAAACHLDLHHVEEALDIYRRNRDYCEQEGLTHVVMEIDYHLGYVGYLQAEYTPAIHHYRLARRAAEAQDDIHQRALCDLDLSEMYLELNMVDDAAELAESAFDGFDRLKMPYEAAKALTNRAIAASRGTESDQALELLRRARVIFVHEDNRHWPAIIDFYRALVLARSGALEDAKDAADMALAAFLDRDLDSRAVMTELLLARLELRTGDPEFARTYAVRALRRLQDLAMPALNQRAYLVLGHIEEARGYPEAALLAYRECDEWLERLRDQLRGEDLKIAFLSDKQSVYDSLVHLTLSDRRHPRRLEAALGYAEKAKSRGLADLLARGGQLRPRTRSGGEVAERARKQRDALSSLYRQMDLQQLGEGAADLKSLRRRARETEDQLLRTQRELDVEDRELGSLQVARDLDLATSRRSLPEDAQLVEYYLAGDRLFAFVLDQRRLEVVDLGSPQRARELHRLLQFQLSRMAMPPTARPAHLHGLIERTTHSHLRELYGLLLEPLEDLLVHPRLVIAPHGFLHYVPFHALHTGDDWLIDRLTISYAPSLGVYHLCAQKPPAAGERSLVLGVADERAPHILGEVRAVRAALGDATLLEGDEASEEALRLHGASCRYLHIATHGLFRPDNPMFSAIQLGTSRLSLFDLYNLRLSAQLVVLSGCGTGLNAVEGADELVGLTRGLLYAGARAVLVTLWDVHDRSTAELMRRLYGHLATGAGPAEALRAAMRSHREDFPQPYYWAPFVLVGQPN